MLITSTGKQAEQTRKQHSSMAPALVLEFLLWLLSVMDIPNPSCFFKLIFFSVLRVTNKYSRVCNSGHVFWKTLKLFLKVLSWSMQVYILALGLTGISGGSVDTVTSVSGWQAECCLERGGCSVCSVASDTQIGKATVTPFLESQARSVLSPFALCVCRVHRDKQGHLITFKHKLLSGSVSVNSLFALSFHALICFVILSFIF